MSRFWLNVSLSALGVLAAASSFAAPSPSSTPTPSPTATATVTVTPLGTGLAGQYFDNEDFSNFVLCRIDPGVNFNWGAGSPDPAIAANTFSVRWIGQVVPQYSETYSFSTYSDDGTRLWVNGQLIIDDWTQHAALTRTATIALTAGVSYSIQLDYFQIIGSTLVTLSWSSPSQPIQVIPASRLYNSGCGPTPTAVPTSTPAVPSCVQSDPFNAGSVSGIWGSADIGVQYPPGFQSEASSLSISSSGYDIGGAADSFHYLYQTAGGDLDLSLQINAVPTSGANSKIGLVMRESLAPEAPSVWMGSIPAHYQMIARTATAANSITEGSAGAFASPGYARLIRSGNAFGGYYSANGSTWTQEGVSVTVAMASNYFVGLGVSSNNTAITGTANVNAFTVLHEAFCTPGQTPSLTATPTPSPSFSASPSATRSATPSVTPSNGPSLTVTRSPSPSASPSPGGSTGAPANWSVTLQVYDASGRLLRSLSVADAGAALGNVSLGGNPWDPSKGPLWLNSGAWAASYDGKDSQGNYLPSGDYQIQIDSSFAGASASQSKDVTVIRSDSGLDSARAWPNPVFSGASSLQFSWSPAGQQIEAEVYDQAGERVAVLGSLSGGQGAWDFRNLANGIYFVTLRIPGQGRPRIIKVAIAR
jgi:hypothetical protein